MKKNILTIIGFLVAISINAQKLSYSFGFQVNKLQIGSLTHSLENPHIPASAGYYTIVNSYNIEERYNDNLGFKMLGNIDISINDKFSIRSGLRLNLLRYYQKAQVSADYNMYFNSGEVIGVVYTSSLPIGINGQPIIIDGSDYNIPTHPIYTDNSKQGKTSILYTEIPISALYKYHRFKFETGVSASIRTYSSRYMLDYDQIEGVRTLNRVNDSGINKVILLMNLGVSYNLLNGIDFTMQYSRGLNGIYTNSLGNNGIPKYNIFSFGVNYNIK